MRFFNGVKISTAVLSIILFSNRPAFSQDIEVIKDPDSLYSLARTAAFGEKNYDKAIMYAQRGLQLSPNYIDLVVFMGSLYTWKKDTDSARYFFEKAISRKPEYVNTYSAYSDMEFWSDRDSASLLVLDRGLKYHPSSVALLSRKARVLEELRDYRAAAYYADSALRIDRRDADALGVRRRIQDYISGNRIGLKYDYVYFDKQFNDPWQLLAIDYTRQTSVGSVTGRINYANRFANNGLQFEVDAYPRISKTFYAYVNAGYAHNLDTSDVFPKWRTGLSLFANLPSGFEAEAGVRYLYFTSGTDFYTAYLGKYIGNFLLGARTFLTPAANKSSHSYNVTARYYFGAIDDYINLLLGYGISPDDRAVAPQLTVANLKTYKAEAIFRKSVKRLNIFTANASIANQEFIQGTLKTGNQFQFGLGYIRRF